MTDYPAANVFEWLRLIFFALWLAGVPALIALSIALTFKDRKLPK